MKHRYTFDIDDEDDSLVVTLSAEGDEGVPLILTLEDETMSAGVARYLSCTKRTWRSV